MGQQMLELSNGFAEAVEASIETRKTAAITVFTATATFTVLVLLSFPEYSYQLITANPLYLETAVESLTLNLYESSGLTAVGLTVIYAALGGIAISNMAAQLKISGVDLKNIAAISPGLLASGCASCGAGVLGLLGFTGALAAMPFQGNLVRLGAILLLFFFLGKSGHPKKCRIE